MKLLLYCTKAKSVLRKLDNYFLDKHNDNYYWEKGQTVPYSLNGKIVAECDFEVEEIKKVNYNCTLFTNTLDTEKLINKSCVGYFELEKYLKPNWDKEDDLKNLDTVGYAIHIKNLHIFDEPKELRNYFTRKPYNNINKIFTDEVMRDGDWYRPIKNAPQNMMYAQEVVPFKEEHLIKGVLQEFRGNRVNEYILISIQPQWLCKILNGEKTIEVRKKVLKGMLG